MAKKYRQVATGYVVEDRGEYRAARFLARAGAVATGYAVEDRDGWHEIAIYIDVAALCASSPARRAIKAKNGTSKLVFGAIKLVAKPYARANKRENEHV